MSLIGRIFVIIFAVILASVAAGIAIALGFLGPQWHAGGDPAERVVFWGIAFIGSVFTGAVAFLPLVICIAIAETLKIRSLLTNTLAGTVLLLAGCYSSGLSRPSYEESIDTPPSAISHEAEVAAASGAVFGFVYWLIAGRNAGRWREKRAIA